MNNTKNNYTHIKKLWGINERNLATVTDKNNLKGILDQNSGKELIPCRYDNIKYVAKTAKDQDAVSIACVSLKNKEGCVDLNNNKIIPIKYDYISDFENHMAIIELNNKFGLISDTGKTIIPAEYKEIDVSEHENEPNDTYIYVTAKLPNEKKSKMGLYKHNENGIIKITPVKYNKINFFHDNLASVELDSKKGYINESGKEVIQLKYDYTRSFNEGTAVVGNFEDESYDMLYGLINTKGEEIVPLQYDYINDFFNGLAVIYKDNYYGYIDKKGNIKIHLIYSTAKNFEGNYAVVGKYTGDKWYEKFAFINKEGTAKTPFKYDFIDSVYRHGLIKVGVYPDNKRDKYLMGLVNKNCKEIIPPIYDFVQVLNKNIVVLKKKHRNFIATTNGTILNTPEYENIFINFRKDENTNANANQDSIICVKLSNKYGFISPVDATPLTEIKYDDIEYTNKKTNIVNVKIGNTWGIVNKEGKEFGF